MFKIFLTLILIGIIGGCKQGEFTPPEKTSDITDTSAAYNRVERTKLLELLKEFEEATGSPIVICAVKDTKDTPPNRAALNTMAKWNIHRGEADNGILILVTNYKEGLYLVVGESLKEKLPDKKLKEIMKSSARRYVAKGSSFSSVKYLILNLQEAITGKTPKALQEIRDDMLTPEGLLFIALIILVACALVCLFVVFYRPEEIEE